jgi:16S rRNA (cytosine967-C5)-methyltransferase
MAVSPARTVSFDILLRIDRQGAYASELLHSGRTGSLSDADHRLATELVMGVLRWRSALDEAIAAAANRRIEQIDAEVLIALRLGTYQLRHLNRIPQHAAINESVELVKVARKRSAAPFLNAVLRKIAASKVQLSAESQAATASSLAREFAHPQWLVERWISQFGSEQARQICKYDQDAPKTTVRIDDTAAEEELKREGIQLLAGSLLSSARVVTAGDIYRTRAVQQGRVFIQDEASQLVAALVGEGSRLLDCCAAPGGKTAALAARNPTATIIAAELHAHRAELLRRRVQQPNVQVIQTDALDLPVSGDFDRVLADVPCSGTGTLARNPEIKWRLRPEDLADLYARQVAILRAALCQLAPGGRAVYSTCSLEPEENEGVVEEAISGSPNFKLLDCRDELERLRAIGELVWRDLASLTRGKFLRTIPGLHPCDGFFAAIVERRG